MIISVKHSLGEYPIHIEKGGLKKVESIFDLERKVLVVTDSGVPKEYAEFVRSKAKEGITFTLCEGEVSKTLDNAEKICKTLIENHFSRDDAIVAVGGGMVGDIAGFASAIFERGIDFYNIPTTVLSQVDSSVGGKTAVNCAGIKNSVGVFKNPAAVLCDIDLLKTLPRRQFNSGLAEAIKISLCLDKSLFEIIEKNDVTADLEEIILRSINLKKEIVEFDERENDKRRILNFGHTIGHAIESLSNGDFLHGECVGIGMAAMCEENVRKRLLPVLKNLFLPTKTDFGKEEMIEKAKCDKKVYNGKVRAVFVTDIGKCEIRETDFESLSERIGLII